MAAKPTRVLMCGPPEGVDPTTGRRGGPCHIYGVSRCYDLDWCELRKRCSTPRPPTDTETPED